MVPAYLTYYMRDEPDVPLPITVVLLSDAPLSHHTTIWALLRDFGRGFVLASLVVLGSLVVEHLLRKPVPPSVTYELHLPGPTLRERVPEVAKPRAVPGCEECVAL